MAKRFVFDVLHTVPEAAALQFTVTDSGTDVELPLGAAPGAGVPFEDANGNKWFVKGDNILLQSISINIPYGFGQGSGLHHLGLAWKDQLGNFTIIHEFADNSALDMPNLCDGIVFPGDGLFIRVPTAEPLYQLTLTDVDLNVSQINAPSVLLGEVITAAYFANVVHTLPMESGA